MAYRNTAIDSGFGFNVPAESMHFRPRGERTRLYVSETETGVFGTLRVDTVSVRDAAIITSGVIGSARLPGATTTVRGTSELATINESISGTRTTGITTPAGVRAAIAGQINDFNLGTISSPITQITLGRPFTDATVFVGGVPQLPGSGNAYTIQSDGANNRIVFNSTVPAGVEVFGTVRR